MMDVYNYIKLSIDELISDTKEEHIVINAIDKLIFELISDGKEDEADILISRVCKLKDDKAQNIIDNGMMFLKTFRDGVNKEMVSDQLRLELYDTISNAVETFDMLVSCRNRVIGHFKTCCSNVK